MSMMPRVQIKKGETEEIFNQVKPKRYSGLEQFMGP